MARLYRRRRGRTRSQESADASTPAPLPQLPHERDESTEVPDAAPGDPRRAPIRQGYADLASGQVDTDARNGVAEQVKAHEKSADEAAAQAKASREDAAAAAPTPVAVDDTVDDKPKPK